MLLSKPNLPSRLNGFLVIFSPAQYFIKKSFRNTSCDTWGRWYASGTVHEMDWMGPSVVTGCRVWEWQHQGPAHEKPDNLWIPRTPLCATGLPPGARENTASSVTTATQNRLCGSDPNEEQLHKWISFHAKGKESKCIVFVCLACLLPAFPWCSVT